MSAEGQELASQSGYEDGAAGGPGAPTPLSALEVRYCQVCLSWIMS
jgi:hypothetical protein